MDRVPARGPNRSRREGHLGAGPVIWIAIMLAAWLAIAEWRTVPELVNATMAALP